jgi:hypothetical protein
LDIDDLTYLKYNVLTEEEMEEIKKENVSSTNVLISIELRNYMNFFNCTSTQTIRQNLAKRKR